MEDAPVLAELCTILSEGGASSLHIYGTSLDRDRCNYSVQQWRNEASRLHRKISRAAREDARAFDLNIAAGLVYCTARYPPDDEDVYNIRGYDVTFATIKGSPAYHAVMAQEKGLSPLFAIASSRVLKLITPSWMEMPRRIREENARRFHTV